MTVAPAQTPFLQTPVHPGFVVSGISKMQGLRPSPVAGAFGSVPFERVQMGARSYRARIACEFCGTTFKQEIGHSFEHVQIARPLASTTASALLDRITVSQFECAQMNTGAQHLPAGPQRPFERSAAELFERVQTSAWPRPPTATSRSPVNQLTPESFEPVQTSTPGHRTKTLGGLCKVAFRHLIGWPFERVQIPGLLASTIPSPSPGITVNRGAVGASSGAPAPTGQMLTCTIGDPFERVQTNARLWPRLAASETLFNRLLAKSFERVQTGRPQSPHLSIRSHTGGTPMPPPK
jgi:hypothetical protein